MGETTLHCNGHPDDREQHLRLLANGLPQLVWLADANGHNYWYNQRCFDFSGITLEEMLATSWYPFIDPQQLPLVRKTWETALKQQKQWELEYRIRDAGGKYCWFLVCVTPLHDEQGHVFRWLGTAINLDAQHSAMEEAQRNEARLMQALDAAHMGCWIWDLETNVVTMNEQHRQDWNFAPGQLAVQLQAIVDKVHPDDVPIIQKTIEGAMTGRSFHVEYRIIPEPGKEKWLEIHGQLISGHEYPHMLMTGTCLDISARREAEHELKEAKLVAEAANTAKTVFLTNISHEIRTPLTAIAGYSELLRDGLMEGLELAESARCIHKNAMHLTNLIDEILDLSRVESGKIETEYVQFDPHAVFEDALGTIGLYATRKALTINLNWREPVSQIHSDPKRLRQILLNLLGNAVKFTEKGGVDINVSLEMSLNHKKNMLCVEVIDTGIGISEEERRRIFTPFSQADPTISRRYGGTGLGLALSARYAALLGGDLTLVSSQPGIGSRFLLRVEAGEREIQDL